MARDNEPGMPSTRVGKSGSGKWSTYTGRPGGTKTADWSKVSEEALLGAISAVTANGAALLFGRTRDGGTLCLTLCDGDQRLKLYGDANEMSVHLRELWDRAMK